jgi:hypothetical protein
MTWDEALSDRNAELRQRVVELIDDPRESADKLDSIIRLAGQHRSAFRFPIALNIKKLENNPLNVDPLPGRPPSFTPEGILKIAAHIDRIKLSGHSERAACKALSSKWKMTEAKIREPHKKLKRVVDDILHGVAGDTYIKALSIRHNVSFWGLRWINSVAYRHNNPNKPAKRKYISKTILELRAAVDEGLAECGGELDWG